MMWMNILAGGLLVLAGRQIFWAFIGIVGFLFGFQFIGLLMVNYPPWVQLAAGLICGGICIVFAFVFYRFALVLAGILTGGMLALHMAMSYAQVLTGGTPKIAFVIGAVIGGVLTAFLLDWAIIVLSSLMGAAVISQAFLAEPLVNTLIILGFTFLGVIVQGEQLMLSPPSTAEDKNVSQEK